MKNYQQLKKIFKRLSHLQYLQRVLMWDEAVMMPEGAGQERANALATLSRTMQKLLIQKKTNTLLEKATSEEQLSPWDATNLNWMNKKYKRAIAIPLKLTEEAIKASIASEQAWRQLRPKNDWQAFLPYLEKSFLINKEIANRRAELLNLNPYDALLDEFAPGFNQQKIDEIFSTLKNTLPDLIQKIIAKQKSENILPSKGPFLREKQRLLGLEVMKLLGFDFNHGRLDVSYHPFCSGGPTDVRVTTRYTENEFLQSLMAVCHETGHALYEQGIPRKWIDQPVGHIDSMAMHESQSLLMEMDICRSLEFYDYVTPIIKKYLGDQDAFTPRNLYKSITRVEPGFIRVEADEATYPLHVILRYEIEKLLFNNEITLKDVPQYWDNLMTHYLGISTEGNYRDGIMQDVHWPAGIFGYFPAYTLGRLIASQLFATFRNQHPSYINNIKLGDFNLLRSWIKKNVYDYASSISTDDLLLKVTGKKLETSDFIEHLKRRYL